MTMRFALITGFLACFAMAQDRSDPILPPRDAGPQVIFRVEPKLPDVPLRGPVLLLVKVDKKGLPVKIHVTNSSDRTVDNAAIGAVQKWRWKPATKNGIPVDTLIMVSIPAGEHQQ